jgi:predicted NBD/HSP70 family sugar kinase
VPGELAAVLGAVRSGRGVTQPMLVDQLGLGRSVVAQRVATLEAAGLIAQDQRGPSTGGRAPRQLRLRAEAGHVLGVDISTNELVVGLADLAGTLQECRHEEIDVANGPDAIFAAVERLGNALLDETAARTRVWSVGVGMPGPVTFVGGEPVTLPTLPDWNRYPTRERLAAWWSAPVWMDNRVNLSALGEISANAVAAASHQLLYLGGGSSIGASLVLEGRVYRGSQGLAGAIGHIPVPEAGGLVCTCGNVGCLEAVAGGEALARNGRLLAARGESPALAAVLASHGVLRPFDVTRAAEAGDAAARQLLHRAAVAIGGSLASLVNAYNPDLVIIGGGIARARAHVLAAIREEIYRRGLPAATRDLRIEPSEVDQEVAGVTGAIQFGLDEVFAPNHLPTTLRARSAG